MIKAYEQIVNVITDITPVLIFEDLDCDHQQYQNILQEAKLKKISEILEERKKEFVAPHFTS